MVTVSVASGKGGAGKTSIAAALASFMTDKAGCQCVFADCDVDAANGAIALGSSVREREPYFSGPGFMIDADRCTGCGRCIRSCRFAAIRLSETGKFCTILPELCERCGVCADVCLEKAVVTCEKQAGELFVSDTPRGITLVHAELEPGEDTSGKLVRAVRERATRIASQADSGGKAGMDGQTHATILPAQSGKDDWHESLVVVDAPPGIGCPVIASLAGTDLVLLVVEASLSGIRDASRLVKLISSMGKKALAIVNKTGLDSRMDDSALDMLRESGIPLAGTIPFDTSLRREAGAGSAWIGIGGVAGTAIESALCAVSGVMTAMMHQKQNESGRNNEHEIRIAN